MFANFNLGNEIIDLNKEAFTDNMNQASTDETLKPLYWAVDVAH